ncbi:MAG TPA: hypothetical protein VGO00_23240 [Kofleriaceae bacterium]|nr:hypothetical protein [Kofleriaceae bacterium]
MFPLDLQLWADPGVEADRVRNLAETRIMGEALQTLAQHDIGTTQIDWNGDAKAGNVMTKDALLATIDSLAGYGAQASDSPRQLPLPYLPARLGEATGSDATLYIGGWAYVAKDSDSSVGSDIAAGILIAVAIIAVVGIIALATKSSKSSGGSHTHGTSGAISSTSFPSGSGSHVGVSSGHPSLTPSAVHMHGSHAAPAFDDVADVALDTLDAFGHVAVETSRPDWSIVEPHDGDSQMYLEMTLVDNANGTVLWHARQKFPAGANHPDQVARVTRMLLASMPR